MGYDAKIRDQSLAAAHVIVGALTLATTFWLTWTAHRDTLQQRSSAP
jgi:hypothetical protein